MTTFYLTVMSRCSGAYKFVLYTIISTEYIKGMCTFSFPKMRKLKSIVSLYYFRFILKVFNSHNNKFNSWIRWLLLKWIDKSFSACVIYHSILIELIGHISNITFLGYIFNIKLPFFTYIVRGMILFRYVFFLFLFLKRISFFL